MIMASSILSSRTIRGITYKSGDSFVCAYSASGNAGSEGDGTSAAPLTVGKTYYFYGYAVADDSGTTIKYPCKIGSSSSSSSIIGYYPESVFPYAKYTIKYNANGGSGAPSSQTKTYGTNLVLSSTKPTRTGYTFKGWALTKADADSGTWYYQAGSTCGRNEDLTLYAVWEEHVLTINYYSNSATSFGGTATPENTVNGSNVLVYIGKFYYDNDYSTYGLANYSNSSGSIYMTRTGYTGTGKWGTSTSGGTLVGEDTGFATGQAMAKALGKDLSSSNASVNVYAQWQENTLTINYYSNYADYGTYQGKALNVSANSNVLVYSAEYLYDNAYSNGLSDIQNSSYLYLSRSGYTSTNHWGTSTSGGTLIDQTTSFSTGQALAEVFGKSLKTGNVTINLYPQWRVNVLTIKYHPNGGKINSDKYNINNNLIGLISSSSVLEDKWNYNSGHENGLYNAKTFGLTREGYKFIGWKLGSSGTTVFNQDDTSVVPTDLASNLTTGDRTVTLYAVWEISGVVYIDNGTTLEPYLAYIDNGSSWDLYIAYVDNGTSWDTIS